MAFQQQGSTERLWSALFTPEVAYSPAELPLVVSACYYATTMLVGRLLRSINRAYTPKSLQDYIADLIITFQVCACSIENIMIRNSYGFGGFALILFVLAAWFALTTSVDKGRGNPCLNIIDYVNGGQSLKRTVLRCTLQLIGGLASYRYAQYYWYLGLTAGHGRRFQMLYCTAGLTVPSPFGFGVEFVATFIDSLLNIVTVTPFFICENLTKAFLNTVMTCAGVHLTGMYLNPVNAFNQEFGCRGVSRWEHLVVYTVGPMISAALAGSVYRHVKDFVKTLPRHSGDASWPAGKGLNGQGQNSVRNRAGKKKNAQKESSPKKENGLKNSPRKGASKKNAKKDN